MVLYGVGGHAKSVYDCLKSRNLELHGAFDDNAAIETFMGFEVKTYSTGSYHDEKVIVSIGDNAIRKKLSLTVKHNFGKVIHKTAYVAADTAIDSGSVVLANATIQSAVNIGSHCIVNSAAVIEHDCYVGAFVHIGPGAVVCGNVKVGDGALIGANVTILPGVSIGSWTVIGAGAVVTSDVPEGECVAGVPARKLTN